ncbi:hypothetical protein F5J12DRAFT_375082 [Pisolithus orientalis]|uniref:uncharacterized protein n=1 Tax=Pisolithus orientalis TaxID=936130 RepID=UPI0022244C4D|nr:uncharacterized protein F5J12DRAFT_375082 [Pisolithus orientalis]KAI6028344.1 hypothetical protein F5J12DRAFT_375082 [Pisolithus orientalis]
MSTIENAVALLRQLVGQQAANKHLKDMVDNIVSCLVLLNSSRPSPQATEKLRSVLREPFQPLYHAYPGPALQLTSAVLSNILGEKLSDAYIHGDPKLYAEWDKTAYVLLSGVLVSYPRHIYLEFYYSCDSRMLWRSLQVRSDLAYYSHG